MRMDWVSKVTARWKWKRVKVHTQPDSYYPLKRNISCTASASASSVPLFLQWLLFCASSQIMKKSLHLN